MDRQVGYYEEKLRQLINLQQELDERVTMIAEDCDEFWVNNISPHSDRTNITYEDDGIYLSWSSWGCGEYTDHCEKIPYEYLDIDIHDLNAQYEERQIKKWEEKMRRKREENKREALEEIEREKAELKRLKKKYPDEF